MAMTATENSQTATPGTEHTLFTTTVPSGGAYYQGKVRGTNLAAGETVQVLLKLSVHAGDAAEQTYDSGVLPGPLADLVIVTPTFWMQAGTTVTMTLKQVGGTGRAYKHTMLEIGA